MTDVRVGRRLRWGDQCRVLTERVGTKSVANIKLFALRLSSSPQLREIFNLSSSRLYNVSVDRRFRFSTGAGVLIAWGDSEGRRTSDITSVGQCRKINFLTGS